MRAERRASPGRDPLARLVRRSRAAMALESFLRAFWPLFSLLALAWAGVALITPVASAAALATGTQAPSLAPILAPTFRRRFGVVVITA